MERKMAGWRAAVLVAGFGMLSAWPTGVAAEAGEAGAKAPAVEEKGAGSNEVQRNLATLESLMKVIQTESRELDRLRKKAAETKDAAKSKDIAEQIRTAEDQLRNSRENFRKVAAGVSEVSEDEERSESLQQKLENFLSPLFSELEQATKDSRKLEEIRDQRREWESRKELADTALSRLDILLAAKPDAMIADELKEIRSQWEFRRANAVGQLEFLDSQIAEIEKNRRPILETASNAFSEFWRSRGLNLVLSLLAFFATLFGGRWLYRRLRPMLGARRMKIPKHLGRVIDVSAMIGVVVLAMFAGLTVLYLKGDWVLLSLAAIFLFGLAWAARNTLVPMLEQLRLVLNLGPVREGERMLYGGLPWRLDKLGFYSEFTNPELDGGVLRLPVHALTKLHSRPADPKEPWFPTRIGDWVLMDDGAFGRVVHQSPEQVVVLSLGGERKTYRTTDFLDNKPVNLSHGYRARLQFGLDYRHQGIATTEVPEILSRKLMEGLSAEVGHEAVESLKVEFKQAGDSSLDYEVIADFTGEVALHYNKLRRAMARLCVEACNEQGWVIPFPQIVVHKGADS